MMRTKRNPSEPLTSTIGPAISGYLRRCQFSVNLQLDLSRTHQGNIKKLSRKAGRIRQMPLHGPSVASLRVHFHIWLSKD
jgi:hypothetical protein